MTKGEEILRMKINQSTYSTIVGDPIAARVRPAVLDLVHGSIDLFVKSRPALFIGGWCAISLPRRMVVE